MRHDRLKKAVEKFAEIKNTSGRRDKFYAEFKGYTIEWFTQSFDHENASTPYVRKTHLKDCLLSDYNAGNFYYTIKSAIAAFTYNLKKEGVA